MTEIHFFTAVSYGDHAKSPSEFFLEKVDDYFCLNGKKVRVLTKALHESSFEVEKIQEPTSMIITCLKVFTHCTLIIPLIILMAKALLRFKYHFYFSENHSLVKQLNPKPSIPIPSAIKVLTPDIPRTLSKPKNDISSLAISLDHADLKNRIVPLMTSETKSKITLEKEELQFYAKEIILLLREFSKEMKFHDSSLIVSEILLTKLNAQIEKLEHPVTSVNQNHLQAWNGFINDICSIENQLTNKLSQVGHDLKKKGGDEDRLSLLWKLEVGISTALDHILTAVSQGFFLMGDWEKAILLIKQITYDKKAIEEFYLQLAEQSFHKDHFLEAFNHIKDRPASFNKDNFLIKLSLACYQKNEIDIALASVQRIFYNTETKDSFYLDISRFYIKKGHPELAEKALEKVRSKIKAKEELYTQIAEYYYYFKHDDKNARAVINKIIHYNMLKRFFFNKIKTGTLS